MEALGINLFNIIIYTILFAILMVVLKKYLTKPVTDMLDKREADIKFVHEQKEKLHTAEVELETQKEKLEAEVISANKASREEVLKAAREEKAQILEEAHKEAAAIIASANKKLEQDRKTLEDQTETKVQNAVAKVLKEVYGQEKTSVDRTLIQKALNEL